MKTTFKALEFAIELYHLCEKVKAPTHFKDQLLRASSSVALNLAEGRGRQSFNDQRRFYRIAYGSLEETKTILRLCKEHDVFNYANKTGAIVYGLCNRRVG